MCILLLVFILTQPEANSKRASSNEIAVLTDSHGTAARVVHDEEQHVPSVETPLL
jgi:hypothetical protein